MKFQLASSREQRKTQQISDHLRGDRQFKLHSEEQNFVAFFVILNGALITYSHEETTRRSPIDLVHIFSVFLSLPLIWNFMHRRGATGMCRVFSTPSYFKIYAFTMRGAFPHGQGTSHKPVIRDCNDAVMLYPPTMAGVSVIDHYRSPHLI